jgi:hypothetical protein
MSTMHEQRQSESVPRQVFDFTLILSGISEATDEVASALYQVCDDALLSQQHGKIALDFSRESDSLIVAIVSAIRDVESVGINGLQVSEVRPPSMSAIDIVNMLLESRHSLAPNVFTDELARLIPKLMKSEP